MLTPAPIRTLIVGTRAQKSTMPTMPPTGNSNPQQSLAQLPQVSPISSEQIPSPHSVITMR